MSKIIVPAGEPILDAARWVGGACWAELRWHQTLTGWLAVETDNTISHALWLLRAHRADLASGWHDRLPVLREFPRGEFVVPSTDRVAGWFDEADEVIDADPAGSSSRLGVAAAVLSAFADGYANRLSVAVGSADGPIAAWLGRAVEVSLADMGAVAELLSGARSVTDPAVAVLPRSSVTLLP